MRTLRQFRGIWQSVALILLCPMAGLMCATVALAQAGARPDAQGDSDDALRDAMLATPNAPAPLSNLYATALGLEKQIAAPQVSGNVLIPFAWNSNAEEISHGGTSTGEATPSAILSWATRASLSGFAESDRYFRTPELDFDKTGLSARLQYVDPANDQAFSPYVAFAPRWDFLPTFGDQISARQDFNLGFNKRFNFDGNFRQIPFAPDTSASTVWSLGLTAFVQRRLREPEASSDAVFFIPSASYLISNSWNANFAVEVIGRWFDQPGFIWLDQNILGLATRDYEVHPIITLEYVIPAQFFGGERNARLLGRPALDLQASYLRIWSGPTLRPEVSNNGRGSRRSRWAGRQVILAGCAGRVAG